ncbi:retrotransposon protein, putative, ty1-copia subclass [Tanacetum coccineum]
MLLELKSMFEKQARVERFDMACKQEEGKPVGAYVLKMQGYVEKLERLGYVLQQDLSVGLILNGLTSDFAGFVGHWKRNCHVYLAELSKKNKQVGTASSSDYRISVSKNNVYYFNAIPSSGIYEIDMLNHVPNVNSIYNVSNKRSKHNLDSTYLWHYHLAHISKKCIEKLQHDRLLKSTDDESFDQCVSCLSSKMTRKPFPYRTKRATDLLRLIHIDVCGPLRHVSRQGASYFITFKDDYSHFGYDYLLKHKHKVFETFKVFKNEAKNQLGKTIKALRSDRYGEYISQEFKDYLKACGIVLQLIPPYTPQHDGASERRNQCAARILNMVPTKKVDKTPYELWYAEFLEKNLLSQEVSGRTVELKEIQDKDTLPSENTSKIRMVIQNLISGWIINAEMQSMKDNQVCRLVDRPSNGMTIGSKWIFKKKNDVDSNIHTYKARLVAKGFTQTYGVDYEETLSPFANIRAIRNLIAIAALYDYKMWQRDVKTSFVNGYIDEDFYMVQLEDLVDPYHLRKVCKVQRSIYGLKFGEATFILGIKIYQDRTKGLIELSQSAYMDKILKRFKLDNSKSGNIPMQERLNLNKTQGASTPEEVKRMENVPFASIVGSIIMVFTTVQCGSPGFLDWKSSKQSTTAMSTTKVEYIVASEAAMEVFWIRKFISGLDIVPTINEPIKMFCDNSAAPLIANKLRVQSGAKHYHRRYNYVRECIELGKINLFKVHTDDDLADPFTKALSKGKLTQHARSMGLRLASSFV